MSTVCLCAAQLHSLHCGHWPSLRVVSGQSTDWAQCPFSGIQHAGNLLLQLQLSRFKTQKCNCHPLQALPPLIMKCKNQNSRRCPLGKHGRPNSWLAYRHEIHSRLPPLSARGSSMKKETRRKRSGCGDRYLSMRKRITVSVCRHLSRHSLPADRRRSCQSSARRPVQSTSVTRWFRQRRRKELPATQ